MMMKQIVQPLGAKWEPRGCVSKLGCLQPVTVRSRTEA